MISGMAFRNLCLPALCAALLAWPASAQQAIDIRQVPIDSKITNSADTGVFLTRVRPDKLFYYMGSPVIGRVELVNTNADKRAVRVKVHLTQDIDEPVGQKEQAVEVPPCATQRVEFTWEPGTLTPYGHAMAVEVMAGGTSIARGEEYFVAASNLWEVGISGNHPMGFTADARSPESVERAVDLFRDKYLNNFEKFFWAPDDFGNMTPTQQVWYSGQARYHERLDYLKHMCDYGRQIGVMPITYGKSIGSGSGARDIIRRRPEMVEGYGSVLDFHPHTEELAKWDKDSEKPWQSIGWAMYNMNDPSVVQHGIDQIIASARQFGWAGVRFDGHFIARTGKHRVGDQSVNFTPEMADRQSAANQRALKEQVRKAFPQFVFGDNYAECGFARRLETVPRDAVELCEGGGLVMDEYANSVADSAHPFNRWADYAAMLVREAEQVRRLGGHLYPIASGSGAGVEALERYENMFVYAAGAHPSMCVPWSVKHPYHRFATRYAAVLWHPDVRNVWNPNGLVVVGPGVFWENYVRQWDVDAAHKRLIVHLLNPPPHESAVGTRDAVKELARRAERRRDIETKAKAAKAEPDYRELDLLPAINLYPDPQKDIAVRVVPQALGREWKATRVLLLDPETATQRELPLGTSDPYFWEVTVPELKFWAVVIIELERKGR